MGTVLFPQVIRDWFTGLRSKSAKSETQRAAERAAAANEPASVDAQTPSSEAILRRAADNNDSNRD